MPSASINREKPLSLIRSMTAFASQEGQYPWGSLVWDVRSINHRYLEMSFRMPERFRVMESKCREVVKKRLKRGKLDATLRWQPAVDSVPAYTVNESMLQALSASVSQLSKHFPQMQLSATEMLRWQGVLQKEEFDVDQFHEPTLALLDQTLSSLLESREKEGATVRECLLELLAGIATHRDGICAKMPMLMQEQRNRLLGRAQELSVELEPGRLEQELLLMVNKQDVAEEMQRLKAHLDEANSIVEAGGVVGRRLDFLMQEFNREANTTASKSVDVGVTRSVVDMKVMIEQIREQVQNIE